MKSFPEDVRLPALPGPEGAAYILWEGFHSAFGLRGRSLDSDTITWRQYHISQDLTLQLCIYVETPPPLLFVDRKRGAAERTLPAHLPTGASGRVTGLRGVPKVSDPAFFATFG